MGLQRGRKGLQSRTAYLGGLKEYCMCPQELQNERHCTQRGMRETEEGERCKFKKQVRNGCVTQVKQPSPRDSQGQKQDTPGQTLSRLGNAWKVETQEPQARSSSLATCPQIGADKEGLGNPEDCSSFHANLPSPSPWVVIRGRTPSWPQGFSPSRDSCGTSQEYGRHGRLWRSI